MAAKVSLIARDGPLKGQVFEMMEHDILLFGRAPDCHICLPPQDTTASRHHFVMEVNPPEARIRDLGSLNGTWVNGVKQGGRMYGESVEEGKAREYPQVDLQDGDRIEVGQHILDVRIELECISCGAALSARDRSRFAWKDGSHICDACRQKELDAEHIAGAPGPKPVYCSRCGRDVSDEIGPDHRGDYVCSDCLLAEQADPGQVLIELIEKLALGNLSQVPAVAGYSIEQQLGVGGMGAVYLARHQQSNLRVALKVMLAQIAVSDEARKRFQREIQIALRLRHPNLVELIDHGSAGKAFYFTMEFCEGGDLGRLARSRGGKLSLRDAGPLMLQALDGLAYMHDQDVVHRDLKPENLLLSKAGRGWAAKVTDYGLAKGFTEAGLTSLTVTGSAAGTFPYMPREQLANFKYVKPVSDVWSIGATFYFLLTGRFPRPERRGQDPVAVVLNAQPVPISKQVRGLPKKVATVIDRSLVTDTSARYQTAREMRQALAKAL